MEDLEVDVAIIGAGPVGVLTANLLGLRGLRVAIFERERTEHGTPRAFSCDDEAMRVYQQAGLVDELLPLVHLCPHAEFADGDGRPFATIVFQGLDFGNGFHPLCLFHQPTLEALLRRGLSRFEGVSLSLGADVVALREEAGGARLTVRDTTTGAESSVLAKYVLGCDGRKSTARRLAGVEYTGARYEEPWIAISAIGHDPPDTMPIVRFVCDPARPGFVARGAEGRLRFEFMLRPGETKEAIESPASVARLVAPYVDPAKVRIERASQYTFEAKTATAWRRGRLFLLGDAAHTMPPFMGQGLVSGLRDAWNLAWKLAFVLEGRAPDALLDTYEEERRPHTREMIDVSIALGRVFLVRSPALAWLRATLLREAGRIPRVERFVRNMEFKPTPTYERGGFSGGARRKGRFDGAPGTLPAFPEGTLFPQPRVSTSTGEGVLLDDVLGPGFALLGRDIDPRSVVTSEALWSRLRTRHLRVLPPGRRAEDASQVTDTQGALGRWFDRHGAHLAVIRPDRFVFGAARTEGFGALEAEVGRMFETGR